MKIIIKYGTLESHVHVNLSIFSIIVVDCWCIKVGVLGDRCDETEEEFYEALAGEMIDNNIDSYGTRNTSTSELDLITSQKLRNNQNA